MTVTEKQASEMWCPMVRLADAQTDGIIKGLITGWNQVCGFRNNVPEHDTTCIGSRCMMWRWKDKGLTGVNGEIIAEGEGYCGLAGASI